MRVDTAIKYVQSAMDSYTEAPLMMDAWKTLKSAVLAAQTTNKRVMPCAETKCNGWQMSCDKCYHNPDFIDGAQS